MRVRKRLKATERDRKRETDRKREIETKSDRKKNRETERNAFIICKKDSFLEKSEFQIQTRFDLN